MHDIDRVRFEMNPETPNYENYEQPYSEAESSDEFEAEAFEFNEAEAEAEAVFSESEEAELASELLEVSNEAELDRFIGNLLGGAAQALGQPIPRLNANALGGVLKGAARQVLPSIGAAAGRRYLGRGIGQAVGRQAAAAAGRLFGLELEGLSGEDQEFEVARRFVRFGGGATRKLLATRRRLPPMTSAKNAARSAARILAPGLLRVVPTVVPVPVPAPYAAAPTPPLSSGCSCGGGGISPSPGEDLGEEPLPAEEGELYVTSNGISRNTKSGTWRRINNRIVLEAR